MKVGFLCGGFLCNPEPPNRCVTCGAKDEEREAGLFLTEEEWNGFQNEIDRSRELRLSANQIAEMRRAECEELRARVKYLESRSITLD